LALGPLRAFQRLRRGEIVMGGGNYAED